MITRRTLCIPRPGDLEIPCFDIWGKTDGPRLAVLAGVHGAEYASIAAARKFVSNLDLSTVLGRITVVPVVNVPAFWARSAFVTPDDDKNLNRQFPGRPDGSFTEVLAHRVFESLVLGADYLVDMHAGALPELWSRSPSTKNLRSSSRRGTWLSPTAWGTACVSRLRPAPSREAPARPPPTSAFRQSSQNRARTG